MPSEPLWTVRSRCLATRDRGESVHLLVGTIFRNAAATLVDTVDSVLEQVADADLRVTLLLVDDNSTDDWRSRMGARLKSHRVHVRSVRFGSIALSRNFVLDEVERSFPDVDYVCRLDADDVLAGTDVLRTLGRVLQCDRPDALFASNLQRRDGVVLPEPNRAVSELLDPHYLCERLRRMAEGDPAAELPSCNTIVRRGLTLRYPAVASAEDHWFTVSLLLDPIVRVSMASDLVYAVYNLSGEQTRQNELSGAYLDSRRALVQGVQARIGRANDR